MKTGWYNADKEYFVVKPLHNGNRQSLIVGATQYCGRWYIMMGVFSSNATYNSMYHSTVWDNPTSTNKNPAIGSLSLALDALSEIEQEIHNRANGKRTYIYVDGLDERRLRVYTKVLTKKCGYKKSAEKSERVNNMSMLYKIV